MFIMGRRFVFKGDYSLEIGTKVIWRHHNYSGTAIVVDYGSDKETYVLKDIEKGTEMCYGIAKLEVIDNQS